MKSLAPNSKIARLACLILVAASTLAVVPGCSKQSKAEDYLKRAEGYFTAKDFAKAEIEYLNVLKLDKANVASVKRLATIYYDQGKIKQGIPFILGVRELDKDDLGNRMRLAQIFLSARKLQEARKETIYVLDRDPKNDEAISLLSDTATNSEEIAETRDRLDKVKEQSGGRAPWHLAMANLALREGAYPAAEASLKNALAAEPQSSRVQLAWAVFYIIQKDHKNTEVAFQKAAELSPLDPSVCLRLAEFKLLTGFPKEGRDILEQFNAKVPDATQILLALARLDFDERKFPECSKIVDQILAKDSGNYLARLLHAGLTRMQGKPEDALKEAEELKRAFDGSPEVAFELALSQLRNKDAAGAATSVQEALRLNPEFPQASLLQAELLAGKGDSANALPLLQTLVQKHPEITRAQLLLGGAYTAQGRLDDALALYKAMELKFPKVADVPFLIGMTLRRQPNGNGEARKAFERSAAISPNDLLVSYQLVELDIVEKNYAAGLERVKTLLEAKPKSGGAKYLEARIHLAQNNPKEAEAALKTAIEWEPNSTSAYNLLTQIYAIGNRLPEALANVEEMLKKNPKNVQVLMQKALFLERQNDTAKAVATYEELLKVSPEFVPALNNLALILSDKLGKHEEAFPYARKANELAPQEPAISDTLGWVQYRRRDYPRALALLQDSAGKLPENPTVQFHLGMTYYMTGQKELAGLAFKRATECKDEFPERAEAQKRLSMLGGESDAADPTAIADLLAAIKDQPDDLPTLLRLGKIYEQTGEPEKARKIYEDVRKLNAKSVPAIFGLARLFSNALKNPEQALALAKEARKLAPEDADVAFLLGRLADQSGDHQWASDLLQESSRKQPENSEILFHLAQAVYANGRVKDAEEFMTRAVTPPSPSGATGAKTVGRGLSAELAKDAQSFLTMIALSNTPGKQLEAEAQVQQLLKEQPGCLPALFVSGLIQEKKGGFKEAKQAYETILAGNPKFAAARKQLAGIFTDQLGDQQKALEQATKAREVLGDDPELTKLLGKIAYQRSDFPAAIRLLLESGRKRPDDAEIYFFLGMSHYQQKVKDESKRALDRALALDPSASFATEAKRVLAELEN